MQTKVPTRIAALGGIEEIGKNMYIVEHADTILIVDAGVLFADEDLPGVNLIVPSFEYLKANERKVKGLFITHGHEDHVGAVPYLLRAVAVPRIYGARLTLEMVRKKMAEHKGVRIPEMTVIDDEIVVQVGDFKVDFFTVHHSIPDTYGAAIATPNGLVVTAADYRFDFTPLGDKTNLGKIAEIGRRGVALMLAESTNSEKGGFSESEKGILGAIGNIFRRTKSRIILSTFASNLGRIEEVAAMAINQGRKICTLGRSMTSNIEISRRVGYLKIPQDALIEPKDVGNYPDEEVFILSTGSQGEELAALNVMAQNRHAWISLKPTDVIIMSSNPIPGNLATVDRLINNLSKQGVTVLTNSPFLKLHASGHATKMEQQLMVSLLNPRYVLPIHGEYRMLKVQRESLKELGIPEQNILIAANGDVVELVDGEARMADERVPVDAVYIDDGGSTDALPMSVVKERRALSQEGMLSVVVTLDEQGKQQVCNPVVISRGSFYTRDAMDLVVRMSRRVKHAVDELNAKGKPSEAQLKALVRDVAAPMVWREKRRNPVIIPMIVNRMGADARQRQRNQAQERVDPASV